MVAGYIRVSTITQKDNWSVDVQREKALQFAAKLNDPIELYDEVKSGRSLERPELNRLIRDIESKKITKVWVVEFSRLSRDVEDSAFLSRLFQKYHVELYVLDQFVDLSKSDTRFLYNINAAVNTKSSDDTSERVKRTKLQQKKAGAFVHSTLYGYSHKYDERGKAVWFINESEAQVIKRIFQEYGKGVSLSRIAKALEDEKVPQRRGKLWTAVTVTKLLQHPEYFGLTKDEDGQLIKSVIYESILDQQDYGRLTYQKSARKKPRENFRVAQHVLSGILSCSYCGARFYPNRVRRGNSIYERLAHKNETGRHQECTQSPKYFDLQRTDKLIENIYKVAFSRIDHVTTFLKNLKAEIFQTEQELDVTRSRVEKEVAELEVQRKRLVDAVADGSFEPRDIRDSISEIKRIKAEKEDQLVRLRQKLEAFDVEYFEVGAKFSEDHLAQFEAASMAEKRKMYRYAFKSIKVRKNVIEVAFITGIRFHFRIGEWEAWEDHSASLRDYLDT